MSSAGTDLVADASTDVKPRKGTRKGDGLITFGAETSI